MNSIEDLIEKIKGFDFRVFIPSLFRRALPDDLFFSLIIILVAFGAFGLGRLSKIEDSRVPIRIENEPEITADTFSSTNNTKEVTTTPAVPTTNTNQLVGSKNGKKYYYIWCAGAQKITEANRRHFSSVEDATVQGYTPASNCKGL